MGKTSNDVTNDSSKMAKSGVRAAKKAGKGISRGASKALDSLLGAASKTILMPFIIFLILILVVCAVILPTMTVDDKSENNGLPNIYSDSSSTVNSTRNDYLTKLSVINELNLNTIDKLNKSFSEKYCKKLCKNKGWDYDKTYESLKSAKEKLASSTIDPVLMYSIVCLLSTESYSYFTYYNDFIESNIENLISMETEEIKTDAIVPVTYHKATLYATLYDEDGNEVEVYRIKEVKYKNTKKEKKVDTFVPATYPLYTNAKGTKEFNEEIDLYVKAGKKKIKAERSKVTYGSFTVKVSTLEEFLNLYGVSLNSPYDDKDNGLVKFDYTYDSMTNAEFLSHCIDTIVYETGITGYSPDKLVSITESSVSTIVNELSPDRAAGGSLLVTGNFTGGRELVCYSQSTSSALWGLSDGSGCGITSIAMCLASFGVTYNGHRINPHDVDVENGGTYIYWSVVNDLLKKDGFTDFVEFKINVSDFSYEDCVKWIQDGGLVIAYFKRSDGATYTSGQSIPVVQHYIVLAGVNEDGTISCMDPNCARGADANLNVKDENCDNDGGSFGNKHNLKITKETFEKNRQIGTFRLKMEIVTEHSLSWPTKNIKITSKYGKRDLPVSGASTDHKGIDLAASTGDDIMAAAEGYVATAEYSNGGGNYIVINHGGGVSTVYMHNSKLLVKVGDKVARGQVIAKAGSTGVSTGPHCHFAVKVNGAYVNPEDYLIENK